MTSQNVSKNEYCYFENLFVSFYTSIILWNWWNLISKKSSPHSSFLPEKWIDRRKERKIEKQQLSIKWSPIRRRDLDRAYDRAERHDFWSRFLPFFLLFFFPLFLGGKIKGERITTVVFKSHVFLLDPTLFAIFYRINMPLRTLNLDILFKILSYSTRSHNIFDIKDIC